jgi:hypothetical protein
MRGKMKNVSTTLVSSALICFSAVVSAAMPEIHPYAGLDAQWRRMAFKTGFGDGLFRKNVPQGNAYVGVQLNEYLGLEAGYERTFAKANTVVIGPGGQEVGFLLPVIDPDTGLLSQTEGHVNEEKLRGWHIDLIGFTPCLQFDPSVRFFGGIGIAQKKVRLVDTLYTIDGGLLPEDEIIANRRTFKSRKTMLRLSAGVQKMLTKCVGIRAIMNWENTGRFGYLRSIERPNGITIANLRNTVSVGLGAFVKF